MCVMLFFKEFEVKSDETLTHQRINYEIILSNLACIK